MLSALIVCVLTSANAQLSCNLPKRELRAVWLTTLGGLDWPSVPATSEANIARQKQELCAMLDKLKAANFNAVVMQVRIRGTVAYRSQIEPLDAAVFGNKPINSDYDPLTFAVEECHRRAMQLHAWLVAIPGNKTAQLKALGASALNRRVPNLVLKTSDGYMLDPGVPGTADYLASICEEITENYDIDGISLDYIRYPEKEVKYSDANTYRKYATRNQPLAQWRRENINRIVRTIHDRVKALKPWVAISCSPVGKYADTRRYSSGGWNALNAVHQDAKLWLSEGWMDALMPMMYFRDHNFFPFAHDWQESTASSSLNIDTAYEPVLDGQEGNRNRTIACGLGVYLLDRNQRDWPLSVIESEINYCRQHNIGGQVYFRTRFVTDNPKGIYDLLRRDLYRTPALPPALMADGNSVAAPTDGRIAETDDGITLSWSHNDAFISTRAGAKSSPKDCKFVLYRSNTYPVDINDPNNIYKVGLTAPDYHIAAPMLVNWLPYFAVTAIDRYGRESQPLELNAPVEFKQFNYLQISK